MLWECRFFKFYLHKQLFITRQYNIVLKQHGSVQFSHSVVFNFLLPHGLEHTRLSCSSPTPRACSNSCPSSQWCHPTISSCPQSIPGSGVLWHTEVHVSDIKGRNWMPCNLSTWAWAPLNIVSILGHKPGRIHVCTFSPWSVQKPNTFLHPPPVPPGN